MSIVWIDGFDHYTAAQVSRKYNNATVSSMQTGRFEGQCCELGSSTTFFQKTIGSTSAGWRIGLAVKLSIWATTSAILCIRDSTTNQVELGFNATRQIRITRNGTLLGTSDAALDLNSWYYIEWYATIANSIGTNGCVVQLNEVEVLNLAAGTDTQNTANAYANDIYLTGVPGTQIYVDDWVISQESVSTSPTFLGERRVKTIYPNGDGNYSQFTGSDGNSTSNYQLIDETTTNDADYVTADTAGFKDSYAFADVTFVPTSIDAVQISGTIKKDDAGTRTARLFFRSGTTDYESGDISVSSNYKIETYLTTTNPATSVAWTKTDLNAVEAGVKVQS